MKMQICSDCQHENLPTATRCANCNAILDGTIARPPELQSRRDALQDPLDKTLVIPQVALDAEVIHVEKDEETSTRPIHGAEEEERLAGMGSARMYGDLILTELATNMQFRISQLQLKEAVIGRASRQTEYQPTVDLSVVGGQKQGVSRRHATITNQDGLLVLVDQNSLNGTYLNGQRIVPEQPRILRDNDVIRLGSVTLRLTYHTLDPKPPDS